MRVICSKAHVCRYEDCLHNEPHPDDHDKGFSDVVICSQVIRYCPIIDRKTCICKRTNKKGRW